MGLFKEIVTAPLKKAGIVVNGLRPVDIKVYDESIYWRVFTQGSLALGESYVAGDWTCTDLAEFFHRLLRVGADQGTAGLTGTLQQLAQHFYNPQNLKLSRRVAEVHYDLDPKFYETMLDPRMAYTCAYYGRGARTLAQAQEDKMQLVCEKIGLKAGDRVLDIGCGWGSFAKFAAEKFGAHVTGVTISAEQFHYARRSCEGLSVDIEYMDYRNLPEKFRQKPFDHVVSIGMFEAVGPKNFDNFFDTVGRVLKPGGLFLLHTITNVRGGSEPWINAHIFPGGYLPTIPQIIRSSSNRFDVLDLHCFGHDYDRTLCEWWNNFNQNWESLSETDRLKYTGIYRRTQRYYLLMCAGTFRAGINDLSQFVLSSQTDAAYKPVR